MERHKKAVSRLASAEPPEDPPPAKPPPCPLHKDKELELYCEACQELICLKCVIKGGKHHDHDYRAIDEAFDQLRRDASQSMEKQVAVLDDALLLVSESTCQVLDQQAAVEAEIDEHFKQLYTVLERRKAELLEQLHQLCQKKLESLTSQRDQLQLDLSQIGACLSVVKDSLATENAEEVLSRKSAIVEQVSQLPTINPAKLKPSVEADVVFSALENITEACQKYGQITETGSPDPSKCYFSFRGLDGSSVLHIIDHFGQPYKKSLTSSECVLVSTVTGSITPGSVEKIRGNRYKISCVPTAKGRHQLHVKVGDQHVSGSPHNVKVVYPVVSFSAPLLIVGWVGKPWGVAVGPEGEVVVAEGASNCVSVFSSNGQRLRSFGSPGSGEGQFNSPAGLALDKDGNVLVVDSQNHRIQKFSLAGQFLAAVGTRGKGPLQFIDPRGIATASVKIFVVGTGNGRIQILNSDLTFSASIGKVGSGKGQFLNPRDIACDKRGNVYVADAGNGRIQVITSEDKFCWFGYDGVGKSGLSWPVGVCVGEDGTVYVSERNRHCVSVYSSRGECMALLGNAYGLKGTGIYELDTPTGVAVDSSGVVYVCDSFNHRVVLY